LIKQGALPFGVMLAKPMSRFCVRQKSAVALASQSIHDALNQARELKEESGL
jgi:hypothetical protein